ncbi:SMC-Scp complex subunit ScpB [Actinoplanes auranticolor]|uniref:SMC-Scp complex subunit ScpB n=1 Tax=Actinoplanes auranticolor TaxID=47988 RepID=UPI003F6942C2
MPGPGEDDEPPAGDTPAGRADGSASTAAADAAADADEAHAEATGAPPTGDDAEPVRPGGGSGAADAAARGAADVEAAVTAGAVASQPVARARPSSGIPAQGRGSKGGAAASGAASTRTGEEAEPLPPMDDAELRAALEAILLVVDEPVAEMQLAQIVEQPTERVAGMLEDISARYTAAGHGFDLRRAAGGWRLYTRPEYAAYVERFVLDGQSVRLTQAALETLAVVAYKQPVTRSRISAIRGVNCDGVMRTLSTRGLIEECGTEGETGAFLYRTTALFLEKLGLNSVDQLPPLAPFLPDDVEEVLDASG